MNQHIIVALCLCLLSGQKAWSLSTGSPTPCPFWDDAFYIHGKCFKFFAASISWLEAKDLCRTKSHINTATLAEPRTKEEMELIMSDVLQSDQEAWIGAYFSEEIGHQYILFSDNRTFDDFGFWESNEVHSLPNYCIIRNTTKKLFTNSCWKRSNYICEEVMKQKYMIPIPVGVIASFPPAGLCNMYGHLEIGKYLLNTETSVFISEYFLGDLVGNPIVKQLVDFTPYFYVSPHIGKWHNEVKDLGDILIEVKSPQPVSVTLVLKMETGVSRTLILPSFEYFKTQHPDIGKTFRIVSLIDGSTGNQLVIVNMHDETIDVTIQFTGTNGGIGGYVLGDNARVSYWNPEQITFKIKKSVFAVIHGNISMEGALVTATAEIAVFVAYYSSEFCNPTSYHYHLTDMYQVFPLEVASDSYAVFPPYDSFGTVKMMSIVSHTVIKFNGTSYNSPIPGTVQTANLPTRKYRALYSEDPFQAIAMLRMDENKDVFCSTQLVPQELWLDSYSFPGAAVLVVFFVENSTTHNLTVHNVSASHGHLYAQLGSKPIQMTCFIVKGQIQINSGGTLYGCFANLTISSPDVLWLGQGVKFGAYIAILPKPSSLGLVTCQPLGVDFSGISFIQFITTSHSYSHTTTTTPVATTTGLHTTMTTTTADTTITTTTTDAVTLSAATSSQQSTSPFLTAATTKSSGNLKCQQTGRANISNEELDNLVRSIQKLLVVDMKNTSAFLRSKISAEDKRPSSAALGVTGITCVVIICCVIIFSDLMTYFQNYFSLIRNRRLL